MMLSQSNSIITTVFVIGKTQHTWQRIVTNPTEIFAQMSAVSVHLGDPEMAGRRDVGPRDLHLAELEGRGGGLPVLLAAPQEGRAHRQPPARSREDQHRRPRGPPLPARDRSHLRVLRLPLRRRRARHHQAAPPAEPPDHPAHGAHDRRRQQVRARAHQPEHHEAPQVQGATRHFFPRIPGLFFYRVFRWILPHALFVNFFNFFGRIINKADDAV